MDSSLDHDHDGKNDVSGDRWVDPLVGRPTMAPRVAIKTSKDDISPDKWTRRIAYNPYRSKTSFDQAGRVQKHYSILSQVLLGLWTCRGNSCAVSCGFLIVVCFMQTAMSA